LLSYKLYPSIEFCLNSSTTFLRYPIHGSDVNKDWTYKDKDQAYKEQDKDKE